MHSLDSIKTWYRQQILPRSVFIPYWAIRFVTFPIAFIRILFGKHRVSTQGSRICIEAGIKGWELIEYKEIYASASEYIGSENVYKVAISRDNPYLPQVKKALDTFRPTHYVYDPRTGSGNWAKGLWQSVQLAVLLQKRGIVPISILADFSFRNFRAQCAVVTAEHGVVVTFLSAKLVSPIFPHRRLIGPGIMPLSNATVERLDGIVKRQEDREATAVFTGGLYEPRLSILKEIEAHLKEHGYVLEMKGRPFSTPRCADDEYWARLGNAAVIVTTVDQCVIPCSDWSWVQSLVYRFIEATSCGALLVAPEVPGVQRFFTPGEHFIPFKSPSEAAELIEYYLANVDERKKIAEQGRLRAQALVAARSYWMGIDIGLGKDSLT